MLTLILLVMQMNQIDKLGRKVILFLHFCEVKSTFGFLKFITAEKTE